MSTNTHHDTDVLVIGAGIGGICAAARLANSGQRVLLVEREARVGGRASSIEKDGFVINVGAVAIEYGGVMEETFRELGVPLELRRPNPGNGFQIKGRTMNPTKGGWSVILDQITKKGSKVLAGLGSARKGELPEEQVTLHDWISGVTSNKTVHQLFRNLSAAIFAVNSDEVPARAFLAYFTNKGAFRDFGFHPRGTVAVCQALADVVTREGGQVWTGAQVTAIHTCGDRVIGASIERDGEHIEVTAGAIVSNTGPLESLDLIDQEALGTEYVQRIRSTARPSANIIIHVASREPLVDIPGLLVYSQTERICNSANMTATCPELAPDGWHLTVVYAVPRPAVGDFDHQAELDATLVELRETLDFSDPETHVVDARLLSGAWPAQRAVAGYELPKETPLDNFFHVGDGVRDIGDGGTQACAASAKQIADLLLARTPELA